MSYDAFRAVFFFYFFFLDFRALYDESRYREDLVELAKGDMVKAQAAKEALENLQRADAKARKHAVES